MTRAKKTEATKGIIKELLAVKPMKHNELIEETAKLYIERYKSEETENVNDVKGRVGSVLDIMKKESEVMYEGGMYALKARIPVPAPQETVEKTPAKKPAKAKAKKVEEPQQEEVKSEQPATKKKKASKKKETVKAEEVAPAEEVKEAPAPQEEEEKAAPKKRSRKSKTKVEETPVVEEQKAEETPALAPVEAPKTEEKVEEIAPAVQPIQEEQKTEVKAEELKREEPKEEKALTVKPKGEVAQKGVVMDMSFLIGNVKNKPAKTENKPQKEEPTIPAKEEKKATMSEVKEEKPQQAEVKKQPKTTEKPANKEGNKPSQKSEEKPAVKQPQKQDNKPKQKQPERQLSLDEKLREAYLKRIRSLGGDYFEYYSIYLLERYSMRNGRRLEMLKISGGDRDGGIDGEIELTDKFGFKETIYIQSKNWDPDKGKEEYWVVGETLLQQFIGACACKQAKDGKQHCRGIFITTSRFTPDAKRILEDMSDKIVGYDGNDLYETAKECEFGLIKKNGEWTLDEKLLSGVKAFFNMY